MRKDMGLTDKKKRQKKESDKSEKVAKKGNKKGAEDERK